MSTRVTSLHSWGHCLPWPKECSDQVVRGTQAPGRPQPGPQGSCRHHPTSGSLAALDAGPVCSLTTSGGPGPQNAHTVPLGNQACKGRGPQLGPPEWTRQQAGETGGHLLASCAIPATPHLGPHTPAQPRPASSPDSSTKPSGPRAMVAGQSAHVAQARAAGPLGPTRPQASSSTDRRVEAPEASSQRFAQGLTSAASSSCLGLRGSLGPRPASAWACETRPAAPPAQQGVAAQMPPTALACQGLTRAQTPSPGWLGCWCPGKTAGKSVPLQEQQFAAL